MNKLNIISITTFLILLPAISAVQTEFTKDSSSFNQGETLIAKISGNFVDVITSENVKFYQDHVRIPVTYDVKKMDGDFYVYVLLIDKPEGNYSFRVEEIEYYEGTEITDEDIKVDFTITSETADFSVNPGFIESNNDFSLEITSLSEADLTIEVEGTDDFTYNSSISLNHGEKEDIDFYMRNSEKKMREIFVSSENTNYKIPVFAGDREASSIEGESFKFEPNNIEVLLATDSETERAIYIVNNGDEDAEDITIEISESLKKYLNLDTTEIEILEEGATEKIEISFESGEEAINISGSITASSENITALLSVSFSAIPDYTPSEDDPESIVTTCDQLEGSICESNEACSEDTVPTKDGLCCPSSASCEEIKQGKLGKIIGWGMVLVVLAFLFYFFKKYKKARPNKDLLSKANKK